MPLERVREEELAFVLNRLLALQLWENTFGTLEMPPSESPSLMSIRTGSQIRDLTWSFSISLPAFLLGE